MFPFLLTLMAQLGGILRPGFTVIFPVIWQLADSEQEAFTSHFELGADDTSDSQNNRKMSL